MAVVDASEYKGRMDLPRVLIVLPPTPHAIIKAITDQADMIRTDFKCEPVFMLYDKAVQEAHSVNGDYEQHRLPSVDAIAAFATNPDNKIAMVLTGNSIAAGSTPPSTDYYGLALTQKLKSKEGGFLGPVAIQSIHPIDGRDMLAERINAGACSVTLVEEIFNAKESPFIALNAALQTSKKEIS